MHSLLTIVGHNISALQDLSLLCSVRLHDKDVTSVSRRRQMRPEAKIVFSGNHVGCA